MRMRNALIKAVILALSVVATSRVFAADAVTEYHVREMKEHAKAVGRDYAREGERIADDAVDIANKVADNFVDAYEQSKDDLRDR